MCEYARVHKLLNEQQQSRRSGDNQFIHPLSTSEALQSRKTLLLLGSLPLRTRLLRTNHKQLVELLANGVKSKLPNDSRCPSKRGILQVATIAILVDEATDHGQRVAVVLGQVDLLDRSRRLQSRKEMSECDQHNR